MTPEERMMDLLGEMLRIDRIGFAVDKDGDLCITWEGDDEREDDAAREGQVRKDNERHPRG